MSSYKVIARQYRPQKFADVVGQEHITRTLQNAIAQDRVGHAYLFVGPRGTGKTTTARIFAKALNCETPQGTEPCGECQNCREIAAGNSLDVIEIDAASNNGVDSVREKIRDQVHYTPTRSRYKIYIIDEVHMLSTQAWNALLKTLEEPPPHVKFMFATTEPHKVLATILSRCQRFDLKRIPLHLIASTIRGIADKEGIFIEPGAVAAIARAADGGMRDAQSIFDQMIAFCGGRDAAAPIREQDVMDVFGLASGQDLKDLTRALVANDLPAIIRHIQAQADCGRDLEHLLGDLIFFLRDVMVAQVVPQAANDAVDGSADDARELADLARAVSPDMIPVLLETLMAQESSVRYALNKRIALEVALLRCMREAHSVSIDEVVSRLAEWHRGGVTISAPPPATAAPRPPAAPPPVPAPAPARAPSAPATSRTLAPAAPPATPTPPMAPAAPAVPARPIADSATPPPPVVRPPAAQAPSTPAASASPAASAPAAYPAISPDSLSEAELWARLCDRVADVAGQRDIAEGLRSSFKPVSRRGGTLTVAWDDAGAAFAAKLEADKPLLTLEEEQFRALCGNPAAKIARKRWIAELSDGQKKPRQAATAESRLSAEQNPFVKDVCDLFNGTIIDSRGTTT